MDTLGRNGERKVSRGSSLEEMRPSTSDVRTSWRTRGIQHPDRKKLIADFWQQVLDNFCEDQFARIDNYAVLRPRRSFVSLFLSGCPHSQSPQKNRHTELVYRLPCTNNCTATVWLLLPKLHSVYMSDC